MRRWMGFICVLAICLAFLSAAPCFRAADGFSCDYVPRTERGKVFYIEIRAPFAVSAAIWELDFDTEIVEHSSVSAVESTSAVRYRTEGGRVRIAFGDSGAVQGTLCRVTFKAIAEGECRFVLHTEQATDAELRYLEGYADYVLTVTFGSSDVPTASGSASRGSRGSSSSASRSSGSTSSRRSSSSRSGVNDNDDADDADGDLTDLHGRSDMLPLADLRADNRWQYIAIGAGAVLLMAGLVLAGFLLGKKLSVKKPIPDAVEDAAGTALRERNEKAPEPEDDGSDEPAADGGSAPLTEHKNPDEK